MATGYSLLSFMNLAVTVFLEVVNKFEIIQ